jgi:hypothetical protein
MSQLVPVNTLNPMERRAKSGREPEARGRLALSCWLDVGADWETHLTQQEIHLFRTPMQICQPT